MNETTQNNDNIYIYLVENGKILHIESKQPNFSKAFETKSEYLCDIGKLYEYLGSQEAKEAGIDRDKIIADFYQSKSIELNDKATFKIELKIDVALKNTLLWSNITFMEKVDMTFHIENNIEVMHFTNNTFKDNFTCEITNNNHNRQKHIKFEKNAFNRDFKYSSNEITSFEECNFQEINLNNHIFHNSIYFTNSTFNEIADFSQCEFEKTASFYRAVFKKTPNFSQAQFGGNLNLVNAKLDFDFEKTKQGIEAQQEKNDRTLTTKQQKSLDSVANDFRDSFRSFKSTLIKDNNLLDASNFHRVELYCKEIELAHKENKTLKDKIDRIVLQFYRLTSDHHTDLIKIIGWVIALIGSLGIFLFLIKHYNVWDFCCFALIATYSILIWILMLYFRIIAIVPFLILIYYDPKYIFGIANIFGNTHSGFENILLSIYSILLFLLVFSLQKTARKNSIIPH